MSADTEVDPADVIALPPSDEPFDGDHVPVLMDLVMDRLKDYVSQAVENDEPVSLLGFGMEIIYQTGFQEGQQKRRR